MLDLARSKSLLHSLTQTLTYTVRLNSQLVGHAAAPETRMSWTATLNNFSHRPLLFKSRDKLDLTPTITSHPFQTSRAVKTNPVRGNNTHTSQTKIVQPRNTTRQPGKYGFDKQHLAFRGGPIFTEIHAM